MPAWTVRHEDATVLEILLAICLFIRSSVAAPAVHAPSPTPHRKFRHYREPKRHHGRRFMIKIRRDKRDFHAPPFRASHQVPAPFHPLRAAP
jgi:hypothetical protein